MRRALRGLLVAGVVGGGAMLMFSQPALAEGGCSLADSICKSITIEICVPPDPCFPTTFDFPGRPTDE